MASFYFELTGEEEATLISVLEQECDSCLWKIRSDRVRDILLKIESGRNLEPAIIVNCPRGMSDDTFGVLKEASDKIMQFSEIVWRGPQAEE